MNPKESWEHIDIGAHLRLLSGFPFASDRFSPEEGFPLIRIRDVIDSKIETYYRGPILPSYVIKRNDILIGMDGDFNVSRWKNQDALLNQRVLKVDVSDAGKIDLNFIYYWLQPFIRKINEATAATTVKHLSIKDIVKARDFLPPQKSQRKIARILQTIDHAIEQTEALIDKYQQIKAGLMHDLFTRGIGPDGQLRPPREQAPQLYQKTPIGWIPKEWGLRNLGGMAKIVAGVTLGSKDRASSSIEVPYLRVANVQDGYLDLSEIKIVRVSQKELENLRLQPGDVLMNEGGDFDKLGRGAVWKGEIDDCVHQNHVFRVRPDSSVLRSLYLAYHSESQFGKKYFLLSSKQSTNLASINSKQLGAYPIALPSCNEQDRIVQRLSGAKRNIDSLQSESEKLRKQKSGMMHDLLTGKIQISTSTR